MKKLKYALVRVPYLSIYNRLDVREEPILTSLSGYLSAVNEDYDVFDFHLDRNLVIDDVLESNATTYIIAIRGTGLHWKYAKKVTNHILNRTSSQIILYGQTGKLQYWKNPNTQRVKVVMHDEDSLASLLLIDKENTPKFEGELLHKPYFTKYLESLGERKNIFKATIETTRGCHFGCSFCFINHGKNYKKRYLRRPNISVLRDVQNYVNLGVKQFWFYDSEFIGADERHYPQIIELLKELKDRFSNQIEIMIYSRSDTLAKFGNFELMKQAGIKSILLGVESLNDSDLDLMKKRQSSNQSTNVILQLVESGIFCNLSFMLFNKSSTIKSLQENIKELSKLYRCNNYIYLGQTIYFSYSFESDWSTLESRHVLSSQTELTSSTNSTDSGSKGVTFDSQLEPFAEICRVINYEQIRKLSALNILKEKDYQNTSLKVQFHKWATLLNLFTLNLMQVAIEEFVNGDLRLETVKDYKVWVYDSYFEFNSSILPKEYSETITDKDEENYDLDWNGWHIQIP